MLCQCTFGGLWDTVKVSGPSEPDAPAEGAGNYLRADRPADAQYAAASTSACAHPE